ncbi:F0F1-type ATP synthase assembly protein I [Crossiella equi]|uniref:F0F1-type ATP synthase assembly protein I n=1 Tax=Crossiella equi TaxID=130796 RepID=A0ABS5AJN4_9PSEU|nr:AtpZ/AtpI family protein [Crossiella equi]MBP2476783.1 F0F1-type ATP synthase assembly protein I [Crossiella equi]
MISLLMAGFLVWGAAGWGLDKLLGTRFLTPAGVLLGFAGSIYLIIVKYGRPGDLTGSPKADVPPSRTDDTEDKG